MCTFFVCLLLANYYLDDEKMVCKLKYETIPIFIQT